MKIEIKKKKKRMKRGEIRVRKRDELKEIMWREKREIWMLNNINNEKEEGNLWNERGKEIKKKIVMDYKNNMGYVDKGERMDKS